MTQELPPDLQKMLDTARVLPFEMPDNPPAPSGFVKVTPATELATVYVRVEKIHSVLVKPKDLPMLAADGTTQTENLVMLIVEPPESGKSMSVVVEESLEDILKAIEHAK